MAMEKLFNEVAVLYGVDDLRVEERTLDLNKVGPLDVLIRVCAVGICGSDVHYWKAGSCGSFVIDGPMVIGHESAGEVVSVGQGVSNLTKGDFVAMEPGVDCQKCQYCLSGRYNLCENMKFFATPPIDGSLARYIIHPAHRCFRIPENLTVEHGALCEPLSIGIHGCNRGEVKQGSKVLIMGCGPIGFVVLSVAHAFGASKIAITDYVEERLEFARTQIPNCDTINLTGLSVGEVAARTSELIGTPDVVIDCAGFETSMRVALATVKSGGKVVLIGCGQNEMTLPLTGAAQREVDIFGVFRYQNTYPEALRLLSSGLVDLTPMITHRFGFSQSDVTDGFKTAHSGRGGAMKVMFRLDDSHPK